MLMTAHPQKARAHISACYLIKLASRGLARDLRRTLITGLTISLGLALFLFVDQLSQGSYDALIKRGVSQSAGHLVIEPRRVAAPGEARALVPQSEALAQQVSERLNAQEISAKLTPRLWLGGLLRSPTNTARVGLLAIDPERERAVSDWASRADVWLNKDDARGALLGAALADRLEVQVGDKVVLS